MKRLPVTHRYNTDDDATCDEERKGSTVHVVHERSRAELVMMARAKGDQPTRSEQLRLTQSTKLAPIRQPDPRSDQNSAVVTLLKLS